MDEPKRAILNARVSSSRQAKQGDSIQSQEERLKKFSKDRNFEIVKILSDAGKSASLKKDNFDVGFDGRFLYLKFDLEKRPGLREIMNRAKEREFDVVCFYKWDRFSRSIAFAEGSKLYFDKYDISLIPSDDSEDPLASSIMRAVGQEEIRKMKSRVRDVRQYRFEKGMMVGRSPFGYKPIIKDKKVIGFKINPKEAEVVRKCFENASNKVDYRETCKELKLHPQQYYNILKNKSYAGFVSFEGQEIKGIHEPIISEELWNKINF